jgi:hypothetical protein
MALATAELPPHSPQQPPLHLKQLRRRDRRRPAGFDGGQEGLATSHLALVLGEVAAGAEAREAPDLEFAVVVKAENLAGGEHFESLFGESLAAVGEVVHGADGAIGKAQLHREGVWAGFAIGGVDQLQIFDGAGGQVAQQVHEVAGLAQQTAATGCGVLGPVIGGDGTGVAGVNEGPGALHAGELLLQIDEQGGKTPVEAHHQQRLARVGRLNSLEFSGGEAERLLYEHVLTGCQGLLHQGGMTVVAGGDHHTVGSGIGQQGGTIGAGVAKAEFAAHMHRADAGGGADTRRCSYSYGGCRMVRPIVLRRVSQLCRSARCCKLPGLAFGEAQRVPRGLIRFSQYTNQPNAQGGKERQITKFLISDPE